MYPASEKIGPSNDDMNNDTFRYLICINVLDEVKLYLNKIPNYHYIDNQYIYDRIVCNQPMRFPYI